MKDFEEALNREAELARQAKLEYIEEAKKDKQLHDKIARERAEARYSKHYGLCGQILGIGSPEKTFQRLIKQVPVGTKMRPSDFLEMGQMILEMGMIGGL